ncbi:hypothetical protein [Streptomyces sp. NPDC054863]
MEKDQGAVRVSGYRKRAQRRRTVQGTGEARGDGWVRTAADEQLLALATRYGSLTLRQAAAACWGGQVETARTRVRLMVEAGLLFRSAETRWAGTVVWTTERGARLSGTGLGAPHPPSERLLHRLALADVGVRQEAGTGQPVVLTEREVRTADAVPGRAAQLLADVGAPQLAPVGADRGETLAVPLGVRSVHWPDLVVIRPDTGLLFAVEVELTPKTPAALRQILRGYLQARRKVIYLGTEAVIRQLVGHQTPDGWKDGIAQQVRLLPPGPPTGEGNPLLHVNELRLRDPGVRAQLERHTARHRVGTYAVR